MKQNMYCVWDVKALAFNNPFYSNHDGQAIRSFSDEVSRPDSMLNKHPEDFKLFRIGSFDPVTGMVESEKDCVLLVTAEQILGGKQNDDGKDY